VVEALAELVKNAAQTPGASRIDILASRAGEDLAVEVVDDGEGIPEDILFRVSEPFFSTRGRAGLGLTIARDAVEAAGGSLQLASRPGIGTRARIVLPAHRQDDADEQLEAGGDELTEEA
jgi:signal transduction histidine kinase